MDVGPRLVGLPATDLAWPGATGFQPAAAQLWPATRLPTPCPVVPAHALVLFLMEERLTPFGFKC